MAQSEEARIRQRAEDILAVLQQRKPAEDVFTPDFVTAITPAQLRVFAEQMEAGAGRLQAVERAEADGGPGAAKIVLRFEKALGNGMFQLESQAPYRVAGFRITEFTPQNDSLVAVTAELHALPGDVGVYFGPMNGGRPLLAIQDKQPFAVGSTFKLYVLSALVRSIAEGRHRWDEVVPLDHKSLPSGMIQDWPDGAPMTLHTLATLMISISDNSATDQLIHLLGREAVEAEVARSGSAHAAANRPFMTTRDMFALKAGSDGRLAAYGAAGEAERRGMLAKIADEPLSTDAIERAFANGPRALNVEWFASARDVAAIFGQLIDQNDATALAILAVNPGMTPLPGDRWNYIGYKGGSEPGVLNLSWLLRDKGGAWWTLSASWNNPAAGLDQPVFEQLARRLMLLQNGAADGAR
ncbi:serine hydrolase [Altererythrobacter xixiisoli]|uniref:Serine hydrolase n=1 Tax=Croceibacterium xixiisoli TaxID=1476466 RepID=A0A6I4TVZ1_9SPHN|nr:serine hydrolase [Croceibacterium xixiisoli]MXO99992.1 serine hydrolase [Croceibacterium xixiisoli]